MDDELSLAPERCTRCGLVLAPSEGDDGLCGECAAEEERNRNFVEVEHERWLDDRG